MHSTIARQGPLRCWQRPKRQLGWLITAITVSSSLARAADFPAEPVNAAAQEKVAQLVQDALGAYRTEAESADGASNRVAQHLMSVEASFREASKLMPARLDLRFGIASALLLQAVQTNSEFYLNVNNALAVYREIGALDTNGFEAPLLYAAYTRAIADQAASDSTIGQLLTIDTQRTHEFLERFRQVDTILEMIPSSEPQQGMPTDCAHAIVVLGAALDTNGLMKPKLVGRLQQALQLARIYPQAPIVLTGGNQRSGITEAYAMGLWLRNEGIRSDRLHLEDKARDTVANAFYSAAILEKLAVTHVTLVTSANHIRRGLVDLEEACRQRGLHLHYATLTASGEPPLDPLRERLGAYRDALRASGLWAFPGIQR